MANVEENLMAGERIVARTRLHWVVFLQPGIWLFLGLSLLAGGRDTLGAGAACCVLALLSGVAALIRFTSCGFAVTERRVLARAGFLANTKREILLSKVESTWFHQGVLGRVLDYGTVVVGGTGGSKHPCRHISAPQEFRRRLQAEVLAMQAAPPVMARPVRLSGVRASG